MIGTIIRNYKNAGRKVSISYCDQPHPDRYDFAPVFTYTGTALEAHNLATKAQRELLSQAMASTLPKRSNERFEQIAWKVAASALQRATSHLRTCGPNEYGMNLPYLCFLAEHLSKEWQQGEARDIHISRDGQVVIHTFVGMHANSMTLGGFKNA